MNKRLLAPTIILWLIAIAVGILGYQRRAETKQRYATFVETQGTVVNYVTNDAPQPEDISYTPVISFTTTNNTDETIESSVAVLRRTYPVGQSVRILYDPLNIEEVHFLDDVRSEERLPAMWILALLLFGLGIVLYPIQLVFDLLRRKINESVPIDPITG
jgi:hypothetical protein